MPNGFEVYDDSGRLQASDKSYDLSIVKSQAINGKINILESMVALENAGNEWAFLQLWRDNADEGIPVIAKGQGIVHSFDAATYPSTNFGLEVYDDAGKVTFSSRLKSCNVIDFVTIPDIFAITSGAVFSKYYGGLRVAVVPIKIPYYAVRNPNDSSYRSLATMGFKTTGSTVIVDQCIDVVKGLPSSIGFKYPSELVFMVINVTNY